MIKESDETRITILTPTFNASRFIAECVEHVSSHKIEGLEHIVVDGGSTDGTPEILRGLSQRHQHLRFVSEKDRGQSDAMNKGINLAKGKIIGILNADDFYEPGAIQEGLSYLSEHPRVDFVTGDCRVWRTSTEYVLNRPKDLRLESLVLGWEYAEFPFNPSAYFYRKSIHDLVGAYDIADHFAMDYSFILECAAATRMAYLPRTWGNFRLFPGTKTFDDSANGPSRIRAIREQWKKRMTRSQHLKSSRIYHTLRLLKWLRGFAR
jgi:glycosyltransferase involved in cell wall biosynthesis